MLLQDTIQPIEFGSTNLAFCPKLPSKVGEVLITEEGVTIHCAQVDKFQPLAYFAPDKPARIEPQGDVLPMPISLLPSSSFIPKEYQVHLVSQKCRGCGTLHEWSRVYAHNSITSRLGAGKGISNLVPVDHFSYNVPVRLLRAPQKDVPICHECVGLTDLSALPRPADTEEYKRVINAFSNPGNLATPETKKPSAAPAGKKPSKDIGDFI